MTKRVEHTVAADSPYQAAQHLAQGPDALRQYPNIASGKRLYHVTIEDITPEPEQPQWWYQLYPVGKWTPAVLGYGECVQTGERWRVRVYGTTSDRDTKRDALLEAARKAGKP